MIKMINIPNLLTLIRLFLTLVLVFSFFSHIPFLEKTSSKFIFLLFIYGVAGFTDYFDGYFARKYLTKTEFGKFFDPLTDKFLALSLFIAFLFVKPLGLFIVPIFFIVFREVFITLLRVLCMYKEISMATETHGKLKMFFQILTQVIIWLMLIFYAFLSEWPAFIIFLSEYYLQYINASIVDIPFYILADYFARQNVPFFAILILEWLPNILVIISMFVTMYSGMLYFIKNWRHLKNNLQ